MKCQHCGSDDIVTLKGQTYCLNCGYAVKPETASTKSAAKKKSAPKKAAAKKTPAKAVAASAPVASGPSYSQLAMARRPEGATPSRQMDLQPKRQASHQPSKPKRARAWRFSLTVGGLLGVATGAIVGASLWFRLDADTVVYLAVVDLLIGLVLVSLSQAALMYGLARSQDGRPAPHSHWWAAARNGFMDVVNVNLMTLITVIVLASLSVVAMVVLNHFAVGRTTTVAILGVVNLVLLWLLYGVYMARRLAVPAVVVGGVTAWSGLMEGWRTYLRAGGHLLLAALEVLLGRLILIGALGLVLYGLVWVVPELDHNKAAVGVGVLVGGGVALAIIYLLEFETQVWLRQYRHWTTTLVAHRRVELTSGRAMKPSKRRTS